MTIQIDTVRGISPQILRHASFRFQEFSQRYADSNLLTTEIPIPELRRQDEKNRQNSIDDLDITMVETFNARMVAHFSEAVKLYDDMLESGVAKECARFVLPLAAPTRLYMSGSIRSWIHYIQLRSSNGTQKEHMKIASFAKQIFIENLPTVSKALEWI
jgi:thymidylate synthase (FAD)